MKSIDDFAVKDNCNKPFKYMFSSFVHLVLDEEELEPTRPPTGKLASVIH